MRLSSSYIMALHAQSSPSVTVYKTLSSIFDFPDEDQKLQWHSITPMFAENVQSSGYGHPLAIQLYKKYIIQFLGVYRVNDDNQWFSIPTRYGIAFELSLNCSESDSLVRDTYAPINAGTGTAKDPFNTHATWGNLDKLQLPRNDHELDSPS